MRNNQQKELQRLEEALMEVDYMNDVPDFWDDPEEPVYDNYDNYTDYNAYNTDDADVDMEAYSQEVDRGSKKNGLSTALTMLAMMALSAVILLLLKVLGVL